MTLIVTKWRHSCEFTPDCVFWLISREMVSIADDNFTQGSDDSNEWYLKYLLMALSSNLRVWISSNKFQKISFSYIIANWKNPANSQGRKHTTVLYEATVIILYSTAIIFNVSPDRICPSHIAAFIIRWQAIGGQKLRLRLYVDIFNSSSTLMNELYSIRFYISAGNILKRNINYCGVITLKWLLICHTIRSYIIILADNAYITSCLDQQQASNDMRTAWLLIT